MKPTILPNWTTLRLGLAVIGLAGGLATSAAVAAPKAPAPMIAQTVTGATAMDVNFRYRHGHDRYRNRYYSRHYARRYRDLEFGFGFPGINLYFGNRHRGHRYDNGYYQDGPNYGSRRGGWDYDPFY